MADNIDPNEVQRLDKEAVSALRRCRADLAKPALDLLTAWLPHHLRVRSMRRWAAVLSTSWPAERASLELGQRPALRADAVDLVMFYVDLPSVPSGLHLQTDYTQVMTLSFEGAALRAPHARRILLTDERTKVPPGIRIHDVIRYPVQPDWPMYERLRVQQEYLAGRHDGRATVFLDTDIVTNRDPADIFSEDFDVGLTWRVEYPDAPINGGLILVGPGKRGLGFFREMMRCYEALALDPKVAPLFERDLRSWWGDQYALALLVGYQHFVQSPSDAMLVNGARLRLFACAEYNFTPEPGAPYSWTFLNTRHFLHFKGNRKKMLDVYLAHLRRGRT